MSAQLTIPSLTIIKKVTDRIFNNRKFLSVRLITVYYLN
ncbi:hypothetical protein N41_2280 [Lactococcus cremoris]|nr:hypothetical protein V4_0472 [Lactococcus cremoris]KZK34234.1 hypothetical protein N41_2280 [Lactococcus cremoris]